MSKIITSAILCLSFSQLPTVSAQEVDLPSPTLQQRSGTISECVSGEDADLQRIDTVDYPMSWELSLDPSDGCYHLVFNSAFATWQDSSTISAATAKYRPPRGAETECQEVANDIPYYSGQVMYTD